jgi:hypothetical protein
MEFGDIYTNVLLSISPWMYVEAWSTYTPVFSLHETKFIAILSYELLSDEIRRTGISSDKVSKTLVGINETSKLL